MKRRFLLLFGAFLLAAGTAAAQEASVQDDMRFVEELRREGKSDLALEYLQKLAKNPSPELQKALPLEMARTRLEAAGEEPDSGKRLQLYTDARDEFQKWIQANGSDPRLNEVKLDVARVAVLQGRTQLSLALMNSDFDAVMVPEALKARAMLEDAGAQVAQAAKDLDAQITKAGEPQKKALQRARMQAELDIGLNLFDQGQTFPAHAEKLDMRKARNEKIQAAQKVFQKLASQDDQNPVCWVAKAWDGRCAAELDETKAARERFNDILAADAKVAGEAQRLARYFRLLVIQEAVNHGEGQKGEDRTYIKDRAEDWIKDYPGYLKTPEGYGIRFLLASNYAALAAEKDKDATLRNKDLDQARLLLRQVEAAENDFTDRARQLKIQIIGQQGGFKEPVDKLKDFEECYVRAQYEIAQMAEDEKKVKPEELEAKRKEHQDNITKALERGLKKADESKMRSPEEMLEIGNAKAMLAFQYMNAKKRREAIAVAEPFARNNPRSSQAAVAAVYALQCYAELVSAGEAAGMTDAELKDRVKLLDFAAFMEKSWSKEPPGDMARYELALVYINDRDPDKHEENVQKAIETLGRITPSYAQYPVAQYQLAQFCFQADKDKLKPLPGDGEDGYRKRALAALRNTPPPPAGADPTTNKIYFLAKIRLAQEDFTLKNFDEMEQLTQALTPMLNGLTLDADKATDDKLHADFAESIKGFRLYALWAKADAEAKLAEKADAKEKPAHFAKITALLDPAVKEIAEKQHPELKNNLPLARGILDNDLRAAIQLNKLDQAQAALNAYKEMASGDAADAGAAEVLKELVIFIPPQLEELKRRNDPAALEAAKKKFGDILADTLKPLQGDKLTPKLVYFTAKIYSSMDRHKEAADLLEKMQEPAAGAPQPDTDLYESVRVMLAHERRLDGDVTAARDVMDAILGTKEKPGWGRKKIDALMENAQLLGAEGDNKQAAELANSLVQKLLPRIDADNKIKDVYLQCYYVMVENAYKQAVKLKDKSADKYATGVKTAATLAVDLAKRQAGFGSDAMRASYHDLMEAEPDLKNAFLDGCVTALETRVKEADAMKDKAQRDKAFADAAALVIELEKLWSDYGGDKYKARVDAVLGGSADLKAAYDMQKGAAAP
jgi:hypothetical protein